MFKSLLLGLIALLFGASLNETKSTVVDLKRLKPEQISVEVVETKDPPVVKSCSTTKRGKFLSKIKLRLRPRKNK